MEEKKHSWERISNSIDDTRLIRLLIAYTDDNSTDKHLYKNCVFIDRIRIESPPYLNHHSYRALTSPNAGGKSTVSEALSIQYFIDHYNASSVLIEKEIEYWIDYKIVDFVCTLNNQRVGVSVTRAMFFPKAKHIGNPSYPQEYTIEDARKLIRKKLYGLIIARNGACNKHSFYKSILHIWCQTRKIADLLKQAYSELDIDDFNLDVKGVVSVILTVCEYKGLYINKLI